MNITRLAASYNQIRSYIEDRGFESDLAEIHADAALEALRKSKIACKSDLSLASVINHLEVVEAALVKYRTSGTAFTRARRGFYELEIKRFQLVVTRIMMGTCYIYIGEKQLARDALVRALALFKGLSQSEADWTVAGMVVSGIAGRGLIDFFKNYSKATELDDAGAKRVIDEMLALL